MHWIANHVLRSNETIENAKKSDKKFTATIENTYWNHEHVYFAFLFMQMREKNVMENEISVRNVE